MALLCGFCNKAIKGSLFRALARNEGAFTSYERVCQECDTPERRTTLERDGWIYGVLRKQGVNPHPGVLFQGEAEKATATI